MILLLKGKASQALTDLIVFSFKWILSSFFWINPASFSPTLVSVPSHRGACIAFFHFREHVAWIRIHCSSSEPKSSLVPILDYISVCVETDWAGCVLLHTHTTTRWCLALIHFVRQSTVRVIVWKPLYWRSKMTCFLLICTLSQRAHFPRLIRSYLNK